MTTDIKFARVEMTLELDEPPPTFRANVKARKGGGRYNDEKYVAYRQRIHEAVKERLDEIIIDGPVILRTHFSFPLPKQLSGVRRQYKKDRGKEGVPHTVRPDISNMVRLVEDSLEGVFYRNDGQISTSISGKSYHTNYERKRDGWFSESEIVSGPKWYVYIDCEGIGEWRRRDDDN